MDEDVDSATASTDSSDDPVIHQIPVFLTKDSLVNIYLLQYPLHPAHLPYDGDSVIEAKIKPKQSQLELTMSLDTRGQHFSRSRGEQYARYTESDENEPFFKSGYMDRKVLVSHSRKEQDTALSRYVIGVYKDSQLHLTTLRDIIQLRPSLRHLEVKQKLQNSAAGAVSDGDTTATESEDEAKPVKVRFAHSSAKAMSQCELADEPWQILTYYPLESIQATSERSLLFANDEDNQSNSFTVSSHDFLNTICPIVTNQKSESPPCPSDVLSLTQLKSLPREKQVVELMKKAMVLPFDQICTMLGRGKTERGSVLEDVQKCSLLVQGCWVIQSALLYPKECSHLRNARDYVLWCFTQNHTLTRKDLAGLLKITTAQLRDILQPMASYRAGNGWELKTQLDREFIVKYPQIVLFQQELWQKRHSELVQLYSIGTSPESGAAASKSAEKSAVISGSDVVKNATLRAKQKMEAILDSTPSRPHLLQPSQLLERHEVPEGVAEALRVFCKRTIGKGVVSTADIRDRLLIHQSSCQEDDPLRGIGISTEMIERALNDIGCLCMGQQHLKQLFVLETVNDRTDKYREIILNMLKTAKSVRRKQVTEAISKRFVECDNKLLTTTLKDLCVSRGSQWYLKGT